MPSQFSVVPPWALTPGERRIRKRRRDSALE